MHTSVYWVMLESHWYIDPPVMCSVLPWNLFNQVFPTTKMLSWVQNPSPLWVYWMHSWPQPRDFLSVSKAQKPFKIIPEDPYSRSYSEFSKLDLADHTTRPLWNSAEELPGWIHFFPPSAELLIFPLSCNLFTSTSRLLYSIWKYLARSKWGGSSSFHLGWRDVHQMSVPGGSSCLLKDEENSPGAAHPPHILQSWSKRGRTPSR